MRASLANLDEKEREVVQECLRATVEGPFFPDWEFETIFGLKRDGAEFTSGRRRYVCRAFALTGNSGTGSRPMTGLLIERDTPKTVNVSEAAEQFHLTQREQETIGVLTLGLTSKEIATRMNISPNTVKTFFRLVMTKMGVSTRSGIVGKIARM